MNKHEYIYTTDKVTHKGYFNIHQGCKGGIYLGMNVAVTLLSKHQIEELKIDVYGLDDFDVDLYNSFYAENMVVFDKAVTELMHGTERILKDPQESDGWISTKDRLPNKFGTYIIYGRFTKDSPIEVFDAEWSPTRRNFNCMGTVSKNVTHWMNLPKAPKL